MAGLSVRAGYMQGYPIAYGKDVPRSLHITESTCPASTSRNHVTDTAEDSFNQPMDCVRHILLIKGTHKSDINLPP